MHHNATYYKSPIPNTTHTRCRVCKSLIYMSFGVYKGCMHTNTSDRVTYMMHRQAVELKWDMPLGYVGCIDARCMVLPNLPRIFKTIRQQIRVENVGSSTADTLQCSACIAYISCARWATTAPTTRTADKRKWAGAYVPPLSERHRREHLLPPLQHDVDLGVEHDEDDEGDEAGGEQHHDHGRLKSGKPAVFRLSQPN